MHTKIKNRAFQKEKKLWCNLCPSVKNVVAIAFLTDYTQNTLKQKRFNIITCSADFGSFLLSGTHIPR